jgi:hypothetical protein
LRECLEQQALVVQQRNEAMGNGGAKFSRVQLASEGVEREGILAEEVQLENGLWIGEVELSQVCVKTGTWRSEVWNSGRRADAGANLGS